MHTQFLIGLSKTVCALHKQGRNKVQKIGGANPPKKSFKNSYFPLLYGPSKKIGGAIAPPAPPVVTALAMYDRVR